MYRLVSKCQSCPQDGSQVTYKWKLKHFLAGGSFIFVAIGILRLLLEITARNEIALKLTGRFLKLTQVIYTAKTNFTQKQGRHFSAVRSRHLGFVNTCWPKMALSSCSISLQTSAFYQSTGIQNNSLAHIKYGQAKRYNCFIVALLCHNVLEHRNDWDTSVQPPTYA